MPAKKTTGETKAKAKKPAAKKATTIKTETREEVMATRTAPTFDQVRELAAKLWAERGRPFGSPEVDWLRAEEILNAA